MTTRSKRGLSAGAGLLAGVITLTCLAHAEIIDRIVAVVGRHVITCSDVRAALAFGLVEAGGDDPATHAVRQLVDRELILREADRFLPPAPDPGAAERELARVRARFATEEDFRQAAAESGMSEARLRTIVEQNVRIRVYLDQRFAAAAQPTDDEIARFYRDHEADLTRQGVLPPLSDVREEIRRRLAAARRQALVDDWLEGLRRRTDITILLGAS